MRNNISRTTLASLAFLALACSSKPKAEPATLVLNQGRIVTVDDRKPEAQALAARGDTIVAIGTNEEIAAYVGPQTRVVDLRGRLAIPGFIDGHGHFTGVGEARIVLNLTKVKNWDDVVAMVKEAAQKAKPGEWILGRGWHQDKWDRKPQPTVEGFPTHRFPERRVTEQSGRPDPRQRPRHLRECQGHGAGRGHARRRQAPPGARSSRTRRARRPASSARPPRGSCRTPTPRPARE